MLSSPPQSRRAAGLLALLVLLAFVSGILQLAGPLPAIVSAQIDNNQPSQPFASVVDCIRAGQDINGANATSISPRFVTTCYASRLHIGGYNAPGGNPNNGDALASDTAIVEFGDAQADSADDLAGVTGNGHAPLSTVGEVGSVYGLAYATGANAAAPALARTQRLFAGAYQKRLTRFGAGGPGGIYVTNRSLGTSSLYVTVPNVAPGPNGAAYNAGDGTVAQFPNQPIMGAYTPEMGGLHRDSDDRFQQEYVGKTSLGDVELYPSEQYLYALNLNNRRVYTFDTWAANPQASMGSFAVDPLTAGCPGGAANFRPFGMAVTTSLVYVGYVCSAETSQSHADLRAGVLELGAGGRGKVLDFALDAFDGQRGVWGTSDVRWNPWATNGGGVYHYPQPILSDLAFDEAGNLILGFRDRFGDITTSARYLSEQQGAGVGDLLRAPANGAGGWNAPSGAGAEYFADGDGDSATRYPADWIHSESAWGALAYLPGTHAGGYGGEIAATTISPYAVNSGGIGWWNASGGAATAREELYQSSAANPNTFQKAAGLGDLELVCAWRAIGDRVWRDTNGNGVQDAGEPDIAGVRVQLLNSSGQLAATATTGGVAGMSGNYRFYVDPFASYTVRIDPAMFGAGQPLAGLAITTPNAGGNDATDSDADASGAAGVGAAGNRDINPTFDFGIAAGANVRIAKSGPATALPGQAVSYSLAYANDGPAAANNVTIVDTLPAGVAYASASPSPSSVSGQTITWNLGSVAAGTSGSITLNTTVAAAANGAVTNVAQISTSTVNDDPGDNTSTSTTNVIRPNVTVQKSGPATVTAGDALAYTLAYANTGTANADGVQVVDTLPAGMAFVSANPAPASLSGQTITWSLGTIAAGAQGSIMVNVQSSSSLPNGATLINQAQIGSATPGDDPSDNSSSTATTAQRADVAVAKSSPTVFPVASGQPVSYYLDFTNRGPAAATNVVLADLVPGQITGVVWSCASGCAGSGTGNTIGINLGTLAAGASGRVIVSGAAQTTLAREDFINSATLATATPETDPTNNQSSVPGAVWTSDLQLVKLAQPQVAAGATFTATLSYKNNGPAPVGGAQLTDTLPDGISFVSAAPAPASVSGQTLTWDLGALADGAAETIALLLQADPALVNNTTVTNQSQITTPASDRNSANNASSAQTLIVTRADLAIAKTGPARVGAGDLVAFTISYANNGPSVARAAVISDTLPADLDFASASPPPASNTAGVLTWAIGDLNPGASGTITVRMQSRFGQSAAALNTTNGARILTTTADPTPGNNASSHTVAVETADLSVTKTMPGSVVAGVPFTATLAYANAGPAGATSVTLRDILPAGLTYLSANPPPSGPGLRWNIGSVPAGGGGTITVRLQAPATAISGTQYLNQALVDTASSDRDPANDFAQATTSARPNADLRVVKIGTSGPILSGSVVSYSLAYANAGPSQATSVQIVDTPPAGFTFVSASSAPTSATNGALTWSIGDLPAGASGAITLIGTLDGQGAQISRTNTATITSPTLDPLPGDNTSASTAIVEQPDLSIAKTDGQAEAQPGDLLTYTLTIRNTGPIAAPAVTLTETPPAPIADPLWAAKGDGSYSLPIGVVNAGATITRTVTIRLPNPLPPALRTAIRNTAAVRDQCCADPTPGDTTSTDTDTPIAGHVGDRVWLDADGDGEQDTGERGIANVPLELIDRTSGRVVETTATDASGGYAFDGLRLGQYAVRISPAALDATYQDYAITTAPVPTAALTSGSPRNDSLDIGMQPATTTAVALAYLQVQPQPPHSYLIRWGTLAERDTKLFRVERSATRARAGAVVVGILASQGSQGGDYHVTDRSAPSVGAAYYWLIEVEESGHENVYGPAPTTTAAQSQIYLPLVRR